MKLVILLLILVYFITFSLAAELCSSAACLSVAALSICNQGYCQCNSNLIFNCSQIATKLPAGENNVSFSLNQPRYFIIDGGMDEDLEYRFVFKDEGTTFITNNYEISYFIDNGIGTSPTNILAYGSQNLYIL